MLNENRFLDTFWFKIQAEIDVLSEGSSLETSTSTCIVHGTLKNPMFI